MKSMLTRAGLASALWAAVVLPVMACTVPLPQMTVEELAGAPVAFVGTVVAIELRDEAVAEPWPQFLSCKRMLEMGMKVPICAEHPPVEAAVFRVEEPIRGIEAGAEFAVPQSGGADCATYYDAGTRYLFGAAGINGKVWLVEAGETAAEAIARHAD